MNICTVFVSLTLRHSHCDDIGASAMILNTHTLTQSHRKVAEIQVSWTPCVRREPATTELGDKRQGPLRHQATLVETY